MDAAILNRLAELNKSNQAEEDTAPSEDTPVLVEDEPAAIEEVPPAEPFMAAATTPEAPDIVEAEQRPRRVKPQPKRMSMTELRNFAKEAQVAQKDRDADSKKRGFIGKMFNGKAR